MGALYTATTHQPVFTLWPKCFFRRVNLIFLLLGTHTSKISHQAWSKMPCFCRLWVSGSAHSPTYLSCHLPDLPFVGSSVSPDPPHFMDFTKGTLSLPFAQLTSSLSNPCLAIFSGRSVSHVGQDPLCYTPPHSVDFSIQHLIIVVLND